jgi:hypothetical protein
MFSCFENAGICLYTLCCPICSLSQSIEKIGASTCVLTTCLICCIPCFHPIATTIYVENWNKAMGGEAALPKRMACMCCCAQCAICQLARAVKKADETGTLKTIGSPMITEMNR